MNIVKVTEEGNKESQKNFQMVSTGMDKTQNTILLTLLALGALYLLVKTFVLPYLDEIKEKIEDLAGVNYPKDAEEAYKKQKDLLLLMKLTSL